MKNKKLIITITSIVAVIVLIAAIIPFIPKRDGNDDGSGAETNNSSVQTLIPEDDKDTSNPAINIQTPDDNDETVDVNDTTSTDETEGGSTKPKVDNITVEDANKGNNTTSTDVGKDTVYEGSKDKGTVQTSPASSEDRSDEIIKDKEENKPETEKLEDRPVIEEDEQVIEGGGKGDANESKEESGDGGKNILEYKSPVTSGDNPFDDGVKTIIIEKDADEYIGEGQDRPGEGIHF